MPKIKYSLQPNESVIMKSEGIRYGGVMSGYNGELILTNLNIILVNKSVFGNTKNAKYFPVNQIKIFNEKPQTIIQKNR